MKIKVLLLHFSLCFFNLLNGENPSYIPPIAHFCYGLWDDGDLPDSFQANVNEWKKQGWTVHVWNGEEVDQLLEKYPAFKEVAATFDRKVQKADLARYLIVYEYGGFYFDLDCEPKKGCLFDDWQKNHHNARAIFFIEHMASKKSLEKVILYPIRQGQPELPRRLANFSFGAEAKHPLIWNILELLQIRCASFPEYNGDYDIIYKTGPDCLTEAIHQSENLISEPEVWIVSHKDYMKHTRAASWRNNKDLLER